MKELIFKIKKAKTEGRLTAAIKSKAHPYFSTFKSITKTRSKFNVRLNSMSVKKISKDKKEIAVVERIFSSYKKMKTMQDRASPLYRPSKLWALQIEDAYKPFLEALNEDDIDKFHYFLSNFGNWDKYTGVSGNMLMRRFKRSYLGRRYLKYVYFESHLELWNWLNGGNKNFDNLSCTNFGNQSGAFCGENFIVPSSCPNEYNTSLLAELLSDEQRSIIGELGGGCGQLAYYLLRKCTNSTYIDIDLPETLCLAAYYLMMSFPNKKVLLYGEDKFTTESYNQFDMIFLPPFEIEKIGQNTINLFINKNSLGEMTNEAATNYLNFILDSTDYFFHMNHEIYRNIFSVDSQSFLNREFPIRRDNFQLLYRYPDIWHMLQNGKIDFYMDIFMYLYKKK